MRRPKAFAVPRASARRAARLFSPGGGGRLGRAGCARERNVGEDHVLGWALDTARHHLPRLADHGSNSHACGLVVVGRRRTRTDLARALLGGAARGTPQVRVVGHILAVQEQRFRLKTRTGEVFLLTLGRHAALDATELAAHQQAQTRVVVDYTGQPNLAGATAHAVRRAD